MNVPRTARRTETIEAKATNRLTERTLELRERGLDPINLSTARPDFDTPAPIKEAAKAAIDVPLTYMLYSDSRGLLDLRLAIAAKLGEENGLSIDPIHELLVTAGTHEALTVALQAVVDPDDEVVLLDPSWVAYRGMVRLAGGVPIYSALRDGRLDLAALERATSARTRALLFNNPNNPTGTVFTRDELEAIAAWARRHDVLVLVDEIYEYFLFDGRTHHSIAGLPGMAERTITINGVSKAYAMTGWRIGYAAGPDDLIDAMLRIHQHVISAPCTFAQKGAVSAFTTARPSVRPMIEAYERRRDLLAGPLGELPGVSAPLPEGACFFFPRFAGTMPSTALSTAFVEEGGLMLTEGSAFGPSGEGHLRLSFAALPERLVCEVVRRMAHVLAQLQPTTHPLQRRETA